MAVHRRAGIFPCVVFALFLIALAGCSPADGLEPTATLSIFVGSPTASAVPPSPTTAPTTAPTSTARPTNPPPPSATATAVPATATATTTATETAIPATATEAATATDSPPPTASDFSPTEVGIWNIPTPGEDNMSGDCTDGATPSYGLIQITPNGDTLTWKNQEPSPYTFTKQGPNVWQYSGPTAVGDGSLTMTVTFTSPTTFEMQHVFVANDSPNCTHTHNMSGTFGR